MKDLKCDGNCSNCNLNDEQCAKINEESIVITNPNYKPDKCLNCGEECNGDYCSDFCYNKANVITTNLKDIRFGDLKCENCPLEICIHCDE